MVNLESTTAIMQELDATVRQSARLDSIRTEGLALLNEVRAVRAKMVGYLGQNSPKLLLAVQETALPDPSEFLEALRYYYEIHAINRALHGVGERITHARFQHALHVVTEGADPNICEYCDSFRRLLALGAVMIPAAEKSTAASAAGDVPPWA